MTQSISLWSALVVQGSLERTVLPAFTESTGIHIDALFDPTTVLMAKIDAGERPDVIVSTTGSLRKLPPGVLDVSSITPLVRSGIGLGVAAGAEHPSLSSVDDLVAVLLGARSVAYSAAGQSGIHFTSMLRDLGIDDEVGARATILPKGFTGTAVIDGRADVAIQQVSELLYVDGIDVIGVLPDAVQSYTDFSVAVATNANVKARNLRAALLSATATVAYNKTTLNTYASELRRRNY